MSLKLDRVASKRLARLRPLDGNNKHAMLSRGKAIYPYGSPNPTGVNQHPNSHLAKVAARRLRRK